jgi:transposase
VLEQPDTELREPSHSSDDQVRGSDTVLGTHNTRDQQMLTEIRAHCAQLDRLAGYVTSFAKMMTRRTGERDLAAWLERVEADGQPELHTFAAGIRQDLAAVTAGLTLPYSSGATEGNVNRLKALKRQMYGRASLDLLRKRVIHHPG